MSGHWMDSTERSRAAVIKKKRGVDWVRETLRRRMLGGMQ